MKIEIVLTKDQIIDLYNNLHVEINPQKFKSYLDIKTYEDAREYLEESELKKHPFDKLQTIAKAINKLENTIIDWSNTSQHKHYPYFKHTNSGWVFGRRSSSYVVWSAGQVAYFTTDEISNYVGTQFLSLYTKLLSTI